MNNRTGLTTIGNIADSAMANIGQPQAEYIEGGSPAGEQLVDQICDRLRRNTKGYKQRMEGCGGEVAYKREMLLALAKHQIGSIEMCRPVFDKYLDGSPWCPMPGDFVLEVRECFFDKIPSPRQAYYEACRAPSPKKKYKWTHPIVYLAGVASDWFLLANEAEARAFPVYERNYEILTKRMMEGEELEVPVVKALTQEVQTPITRQENKSRMSKLLEGL